MTRRCTCVVHDDGSVTRFLCSVHADQDPCLTMAQVTGRRRKGTIRRGVCTACGHGAEVPLTPEDVPRVYRTYARGLITLGELVETLAGIDQRHGAQPITRAEMLANREAREAAAS